MSPTFGPATQVMPLEIWAHGLVETVFWIAVVAAEQGLLVRLTAAARAPTDGTQEAGQSFTVRYV